MRHVVGAEHRVDVWRPLPDELAVLLGQTTTHRDLHARSPRLERLQMTEMAVELVVGVLADAAGVEQDDVGVLDVVGRLHALALEEPREPLRVVRVHLAPERANQVGACHQAKIRRAAPLSVAAGGLEGLRATVTIVHGQADGGAPFAVDLDVGEGRDAHQVDLR